MIKKEWLYAYKGVRIDRVTALLAYIQGLPDRELGLNAYLRSNRSMSVKEVHRCGVPMCIAGHTVVLFGPDNLRLDSMCVHTEDRARSWSTVAGELLGISTMDPADPGNKLFDGRSTLRKTQKEEATARLKRLLTYAKAARKAS